jgi:hypothetical protein
MSLAAIAEEAPYAEPLAVPEWTLGCFHRRCITFATGVEDTTTRVIWIQSHGLTADLRLPLHRPDVSHRGSLADCAPEERAELARGEGFIARTRWDGEHMSWDTQAAFQPYDKWPEPGRLQRVGTCLIEWAPSGIYVEDWRLQPGSGGLSIGLELISETAKDGIERRRAGGLVIAGDHAILLIGRKTPLPRGRANDLLREAPDLWAGAFDASVAYARLEETRWTTKLAVNPFAEGRALFDEAAFSLGPRPNLVIQKADDPACGWRERLWQVDTALWGQARDGVTPATSQGLAWLVGEADALGLAALTPSPRSSSRGSATDIRCRPRSPGRSALS